MKINPIIDVIRGAKKTVKLNHYSIPRPLHSKILVIAPTPVVNLVKHEKIVIGGAKAEVPKFNFNSPNWF